LIAKRPGSFISPSVAEIRGAYLELDQSQTRISTILTSASGSIQRDIRVWNWESRLNNNRGSRLNNNQESRLKVASQQKLIVASLWQMRIASQLHWSSRLHLISMAIASMRASILLQTRSMSLFCNQFNSTLAKAIDNSANLIVHQQTTKAHNKC